MNVETSHSFRLPLDQPQELGCPILRAFAKGGTETARTTLTLDDVNRVNLDWTHGALAEGLRLYRAGEFFAAHEEWESVWLVTPEPEKTFLQGLIQVTAAFHHMQRNNPLGATRLLTAALHKLEACPPNFGGIAVALLRDDIRDRLQVLVADPSAADRLVPPRIHPL